MIKYLVAAVGLKAFSLNSATRSAYRSLGNIVGQKRRQQQNIDKYVERGDQLVDLANKYCILKDEVALVELGTGWMHWFGLYLALHVNGNVKLELFDVWDNRQFDALKCAFRELANRWKRNPAVSENQRERLNTILKAESFEVLYRQIIANYTINSNGSLAPYPADSYDAIFSFHVLEHIGRDFIEESVSHMYRMLKPGGYCIHQIGIDDHLTHYDRKESQKNYLRYSYTLRKYVFENTVQYHNVLQGKDFLYFFKSYGFDIVEIARERCDLKGFPIHSDWKRYSQEDLETTIFTIVCQKPDLSSRKDG